MNNKTEIFRCGRCGKVFTFFGEDAELIGKIRKNLIDFNIRSHIIPEKTTTTIDIIERGANCCEQPYIIYMVI